MQNIAFIGCEIEAQTSLFIVVTRKMPDEVKFLAVTTVRGLCEKFHKVS